MGTVDENEEDEKSEITYPIDVQEYNRDYDEEENDESQAQTVEFMGQNSVHGVDNFARMKIVKSLSQETPDRTNDINFDAIMREINVNKFAPDEVGDKKQPLPLDQLHRHFETEDVADSRVAQEERYTYNVSEQQEQRYSYHLPAEHQQEESHNDRQIDFRTFTFNVSEKDESKIAYEPPAIVPKIVEPQKTEREPEITNVRIPHIAPMYNNMTMSNVDTQRSIENVSGYIAQPPSYIAQPHNYTIPSRHVIAQPSSDQNTRFVPYSRALLEQRMSHKTEIPPHSTISLAESFQKPIPVDNKENKEQPIVSNDSLKYEVKRRVVIARTSTGRTDMTPISYTSPVFQGQSNPLQGNYHGMHYSIASRQSQPTVVNNDDDDFEEPIYYGS